MGVPGYRLGGPAYRFAAALQELAAALPLLDSYGAAAIGRLGGTAAAMGTTFGLSFSLTATRWRAERAAARRAMGTR